MRPALVVLVLVAAGCGGGSRMFVKGDFSFRYPKGWKVTGFSTTNLPRRLAVTSYPVAENAVEGDCGGHAAMAALPRDGAAVLLIDYGSAPRRGFPAPPRAFSFSKGSYGEYECFGPSTLFRFRARGHTFQAHVAVGSAATDATKQQALAILDSVAGN